MKTKIQPLQSRVLIRPLPEAPAKESRIIIPESVKEKPMEHEVVAVGPGAPDKVKYRVNSVSTIAVKPGDHVLVSKYAGTELQVDGETLRIVEESDLLARIL